MSQWLDNFASNFAGEGVGVNGTAVPSYDYSTDANTNEAMDNATLASWNIEPTTNASGYSTVQNPALAAVGVGLAANMSNVFSLWTAKQAGVLPQVQSTMITPNGAAPVTQGQKNTQVLMFAGLAVVFVLLMRD